VKERTPSSRTAFVPYISASFLDRATQNGGTMNYGIFWGNSSHSDEIFKTQKIIGIIMNSTKNASCRQLFKELKILPVQSQ
jgi:hypothetical protein